MNKLRPKSFTAKFHRAFVGASVAVALTTAATMADASDAAALTATASATEAASLEAELSADTASITHENTALLASPGSALVESTPPMTAPAAPLADTPIATATELLHLVNPATASLSKPVDVQFTLEGDVLKAHFEVRTKEINAREHLAQGEYPYQFDVVEIFVSVAGEASPFPYFEFEVSPYGETFNVKIPGGGKPFQDGVELGSKAVARRKGGAWSADLSIPLSRLGYDGDARKIVGNAFAVLGRRPLRTYWSLSLPAQAKPNFHKPEFFRPLVAD